MHRTELHPDVIDLIQRRRGRLHVHDRFEPRRTALCVIDMQVAFLAPGYPSEVPVARAIVPNINRLAAALRAAGGTIAWVRNTFTEATFESWSSFLGGTYAGAVSRRIAEQLFAGAPGHEFWSGLDRRAEDWTVDKDRFSAFLPGACDLEPRLRQRGVDTVLIAGTVTNVCCESSARDAMMRNFSVVMLADANASYSDAIHNASLSSLAGAIADVMTVDEVIERLPRARAAAE